LGLAKRGQSKDFKVTMTIIGAIVLSVFVYAMNSPQKQNGVSPKNVCIANLKQVDSAKEQWALDNNKSPGAVVRFKDLIGRDLYLKGKPTCPKGGLYSLDRYGENPTCTVEGHLLP
jgi:hypothetical protein